MAAADACVAWHADSVRKVMTEPIIAMFVMGGTCQHTWEHYVPKARSAGPRLSVTFRHSQPAGL